ncbi:uncharacterized protein LOC134727358 [Mytilus trossulus]|uniref:uncharacterized protein LOC134727358 n=1 Tax=Mytilus trossulus TaxID=6551 RepID=UPI0030054319
MFADDTKVFRQIQTTDDSDVLQTDLSHLESWSNTWLLRFHPDKCKVLTTGKQHDNNHKYNLCNTTLEHVDKEKDIGVTIDNKLNFEQHMNEKINKANSIMGLIRRTFTCLNEEMFLLLYKALARPNLEYANAIWSPFKVKDITALENVQRRATKLIPTLKDLEYEQRLKKLKLPTLKYRQMRGDMIEAYKLTSGIYDDALPNLLTYNTTSATRGHNKKLTIQRCNKNIRSNFFTQRIAPIWNSLPSSVVNAPTVQTF